jgi:serine/threonine protein kinase/Flp pilus assembly protein TadD
MTLAPGTRLGRYEIRSKIGAGGMGEVYLAQDTKLDRKVALKILPAEVAAHPDRMKRFVQEAKTASALNHPNIITIYEIEDIDSVNFIATEFIDGETLRQHMNLKHVKIAEALDLSVQIASALSAAHAAGIIHRDIKPENIIRRHDGIVKVVDFGLAKLSEKTDTGEVDTEAATKALVQTEPGVVMGTVAYMSPEQARGMAVDARTDIFSLGVVIYEMVAGRAPFGGATKSDLMVALLERDPPPLARFAPEAPAELERLVMKTLAKDRDERYQTAKDLLIDLKRLKQKLVVDAAIERSSAPDVKGADGESKPHGGPAPLSTAPRAAAQTAFEDSRATSSAEYLVSGIRQHKLAAAIALLVLVTGAVGLSIYLHARNTEVAIESIAVLPFQNRSTEPDSEYLSDGLAESLIYRLSQLPNLKVSPTSTVFRYKGKEIDPVKVGQELGVSAVLSGRIVQRGDQLTISAELVDVRNNRLLWGEQYDRKLSDLLQTQREIALEIVEKLKLKVSGEEKVLAKHYTESNEAYQLYLKGRFYWNKRTSESIKKSIEYFNQAIEKDPSFALAYAGLADSYVVSANPLPPREAMPKAKAAAMRALELDETLAEAHTSLARVLAVYDWDWTGAEKEFRRAIELNPRYAIAHQWYGDYFEVTGRHNESIAEERRAVELDPLSLTISFELGTAFYYARNYDQAIEQFQKTLELDPNFPAVYAFLPAAYEQKGMYDEAIAGFQKGITPRGRSEWPMTVPGLGHVYAVSGKKGDARTVLNELKQLSGQEYVPAYGIALIYAGLGEKDQAFAWLEKAYEEHSFKMAWLKVEPRWDSLRSDPRFAALVRRIGLPPT